LERALLLKNANVSFFRIAFIGRRIVNTERMPITNQKDRYFYMLKPEFLHEVIFSLPLLEMVGTLPGRD
jgi:hypothetical protein